MDEETYEKPEIKDFGSLEELTASCDAGGAGDQHFPDTQHTKVFITSTAFCTSL